MEKRFDSAEAEQRLYRLWEESGAFESGRKGDGRKDEKTFTIVMPPPNVTGKLHIGHALDHTLQDILIRYKRMRGYDCLWLPGIDHAGIATQLLVEKALAEQGIARKSMTREQFLARVWDWKEQYGGIILQQLRRLGASCDWSKLRFTMDEAHSAAVRYAFVRMHEAGLIYRAERLVNWDPRLETAVSDLEVKQQEIEGALYFIAYPLREDGEHSEHSGQTLVVATTRPETLFGDVAVAVHPDDSRYKAFVGKQCIVPLVERAVVIIADAAVDSELGSGALKITPAHDFHDFEIAQRHALPAIDIFDARAHLRADLNGAVPLAYRGLERFEARKRVVEALQACGALQRIEAPHRHSVAHGERSGVVLEPRLTKQWFVDAKALAPKALRAVEDGETRLVPDTWRSTWRHWLENIQPWCISRQLWWGHRIPIWYAEGGEAFAAESEAEAMAKARAHFSKGKGKDKDEEIVLQQDEDVLDTWFSSALWPFSTLGWPQKAPLFDKHFPTDVLVTGFDILFFWVARMMMLSLYFLGRVPFHTVALHPLIRDAMGRKMSKSLGNVVDPLELVDRYGCDAVRLTLALQAVPAQDLRLSEPRIRGNRNFVTKLWNAARFLEMHDCRFDPDFSLSEASYREEIRGEREIAFDPYFPLFKLEAGLNASRWMVRKIRRALKTTERALESCTFHEAAETLYALLWHGFCDRYLETIKPLLMQDVDDKFGIRKASASLFFVLLRCLHPIVPFVTEEIYQSAKIFENKKHPLLIEAEWPTEEIQVTLPEGRAVEEMRWLYGLIDTVRSLRSVLGLPPQEIVPLRCDDLSSEGERRMNKWKDTLAHMAGLEWQGRAKAQQKDPSQRHVGFICRGIIMPALAFPSKFDLSAAQRKMEKDLDEAIKQRDRSHFKFEDTEFLKSAPREVLLAEHRRFSKAFYCLDLLERALRSLREKR